MSFLCQLSAASLQVTLLPWLSETTRSQAS